MQSRDPKLEKLYQKWKQEEAIAHIVGWDFSHIADRYREEDSLPWDFQAVIQRNLTEDKKLLDMETGRRGVFAAAGPSLSKYRRHRRLPAQR